MLQGIQSTEPDVASVATQGTAVMKEFVTRFERINAFPKPPSSGEIFADSFMHGLYGNFVTPYAHALEADEQQRASSSSFSRWSLRPTRPMPSICCCRR